MKHSLKEIIGNSIETSDKTKGKIKDFLFDEDAFKIRYIDADFGGFFKDRRILLPIDVFSKGKWDNKHFSLNITEKDIDSSPSSEDKPTISRLYESLLMKHYGFPTYWSPGFFPPTPTRQYLSGMRKNDPTQEVSEEKINEKDTRLRSFNEVKGYFLLATDGHLGHVEDIIVDDNGWQMTYLIVDTSNWRPWSKKVILMINWLEKISYETHEVFIDIDTETVKNAPEIDISKPVEQSFEEALLKYYERRF
jgi:uncharacterized protein YrrD